MFEQLLLSERMRAVERVGKREAARRVKKRCSLKREPDPGEDAASAGFLPGVIDAVDDGERGNNGNYPENRPHAIEDPTDDEQHNALRALHKADLTQENEGLGTGASVTHHHGASGSDRGEDNVGCPAA